MTATDTAVSDDDRESKRFDTAVDIVLNSGLLLPHMDAFWAFCDGEISEDELRETIR